MLDLFAGSNTTGEAAENLGRRWIAFEKDLSYLVTSAFRFIESRADKEVKTIYEKLTTQGIRNLEIKKKQLTFI